MGQDVDVFYTSIVKYEADSMFMMNNMQWVPKSDTIDKIFFNNMCVNFYRAKYNSTSIACIDTCIFNDRVKFRNNTL